MKKNGIYLHKRWIPFSEICTNIFAIYPQGDINSRQSPSDGDQQVKPCMKWPLNRPTTAAGQLPGPLCPQGISRRSQRRVKEKGPSARCTGPWGEDRSGSILPLYCHHTCRHLALLLVCLAPTFHQPGHARKPGGRALLHVFTALCEEYKIPFGKIQLLQGAVRQVIKMPVMKHGY